MDGAYAHLAACYKRTTHHCIAELNGCLSPGTWLKPSCRAGRFFQESPIKSTSTGSIIDVEVGEVELCFDVIDSLLDFYFIQPARIAAQKAAINQKLQDAGKPLLR
jgi:hypothetical protein